MLKCIASEVYTNKSIILGPTEEVRAFFLYLNNFCSTQIKTKEKIQFITVINEAWFYIETSNLYLIKEFEELYNEKSI